MKKTLLLLCAFSLLAFGCSGLQKTTAPHYSELERRVEKSGLDVDLDGNDSLDVDRGGHNSNTAAGARTNLGLAIGTDVQAYDADLTTYAGITPSANVQTMLGSADNATIRSNIGLAIGTNVQAYDADLTTYAGITPSADVQAFLGQADQAVRNTLATSLTAEPTSTDLVTQGFYWADNDSWDPCSVAGTDPYYVFWSGSAWVCMHDKDGDLFIGSISEDIPIADGDATESFKFSFDFSDPRSGALPTDADFTFAIVEPTTDNAFTALQTFGVGLAVGNGSTGAGFVRLKEDSDNGTDYSTITGASDAGSYPAFTFGGSQGSEDLTLTASSDQWTLSSSTGVTTFSAGILNFVTTGTISGAIPSISGSSGTISDAQGYGYFIWATGAGTWNLPVAAAGKNLCVYSTTAAAVVVDAADGDQIKPTTNATGDSITNDSTAGSFVCLVAQDSTDWHVLGMRGTWSDTN